MKEAENSYEGVASQILRFDNRVLPPCPYCNSTDTAVIMRAAIGRTITIASATTKAKIYLGDGKGNFYCHACKQQFDLLS